MRTPLRHDPEDLRERAAELLARPPYREEPAGLLERAWTAVLEAVADGLALLQESLAGSSAWGWAITAVGVAVLALAVWRLTRGLTLDPQTAAPATESGRSTTARDILRRAEALARAGRWDEAVRHRYRALVAELVSAGLADEIPGRTVGELNHAVAVAAPELADDVARAGGVFAAVVYGREPAGPSDYREIDHAALRIERSRSSSRRAIAETGVGR